MKFCIYQINLDRDTDRVAFEDLENLQRYHGGRVIRSDLYDKIYEGDFPCSSLEDLFHIFNVEHADGPEPIPCNMINCFCMFSDYQPMTLNEWIEIDNKRREALDAEFTVSANTLAMMDAAIQKSYCRGKTPAVTFYADLCSVKPRLSEH